MGRLTILVFTLTLASGCATMLSGPTETIAVTSEPGGADVTIDCGAGPSTMTTPARIVVARKSSDCTVTIEKAGFDKETAVLEQGLNRWTWGNIPVAVFGLGILAASGFSEHPDNGARLGAAVVTVGLGGLLVDRLTWNLRDHDPKRIHVILRRSIASVANAPR